MNVAGVSHDDHLFYSFKAGPADDSLFNWPERLDKESEEEVARRAGNCKSLMDPLLSLPTLSSA